MRISLGNLWWKNKDSEQPEIFLWDSGTNDKEMI
jgi:hypothetical protein